MEDKQMMEMVKIMAEQPAVIDAVVKSHDNNPWWPLDIKDWRMRMIVAGLSTRVSFRMLPTYMKTLKEFSSHSYEQIKGMPDAELSAMLKPLGLTDTRLKFLHSMSKYVDTYASLNDFSQKKNTEIIADIAKNVDGASYKVGQCCVLYSKGYYCGIMPVDSGMKDMLAPCVGFETAKTPFGHEIVRYQMEDLAKKLDWKTVATETGYDKKITLPDDRPLTWWLHLVLINFKRHHCNNRKPENCPLVKRFCLKEACKTK